MSEENLEVVRRIYELVLAPGRFADPATAEVMPQLFDPEVELRQMSSMLDTAGDFHGYQGLADAAREILQATTDIGYVAEEVRAAGDRVATVALVSGTGRLSGAPFESRTGQLFTLRNGRVVRWEAFDDPADAFRAAGLSE
jgi:ketosteroid isomerase-like protein